MLGLGEGSIIVSLAPPMSRHFLSDSRSYSLHFVLVMPAGAPGARVTSPVGVVAPEPGREPLSKDPELRDPSVELRMLKMPLLPNEKRPRAERRAEFIVPTEDSVAAEMEAARVLDLR